MIQARREDVSGLVPLLVQLGYSSTLGELKKLMAFLEHVAAEHSPAMIDLTSSVWRAEEGTHEFYKTLG